METKFRAWHKRDKQMIDWFTLTQSAWNTFRGGKPLSLLYEILVARKEDFDVMMFTGLHDKNGKEIYRHDVIDWGGEQYLVEWDDDCSSFCLIILDGTELGYGLYKKEVVNIEVIGNIHEEQFKHLIK